MATEREASIAARCRRRMGTTASEEHPENAAAKSAASRVRADSNSDDVSGYRGLNHHGRNHEASYLRDSCYFHVATLGYQSASWLVCIQPIFFCHQSTVVRSHFRMR